MKKQLKITIKYFIAITILTGIVYPLFITAVSAIVFPVKSSGSFIEKEGKVIGSKLIGQKFESDKYFWARPSAIDYNPMPSGASNLGPTSAALKKAFDVRKKNFIEKNTVGDVSIVPKEMFFASGSGVDPHISPMSAIMQIDRIALARKFSANQKEKLIDLIDSMIEQPQFGFLGNSVVNVLLLNLQLDKVK